MHGRAGVIARRALTLRPEWNEPITSGQLKHRRFVWINRGGDSKTSGSGPQGRKATPARLLARSLAEREGANTAATRRHEANRLARHTPPRIIW
jgi:hypothetical protein